jgi:type II secretory pathway pseudopilin PulG
VTIPAAAGATPAAAPPGQRPASTPFPTGAAFAIIAVVGVVMLAVIGILVALLLPAINAAREAARRNHCSNQLRQIGLAMLNYQEVHGCFPPAFIADENGKPMHSWRVLILPYLEEDALYEQYDFDQPWDSPQNLAVAARMPGFYTCPSEGNAAPNTTSYVLVTGPQMAFQGDRSPRIQDFRDGTSKTLLVVETSPPGIGWTEPVDLDAASMTFQINGGPGEIGSQHNGGIAMGVFADCHTKPLSEDMSPADVRALCTRAGNENVQGW